jgi:hypothetical protein
VKINETFDQVILFTCKLLVVCVLFGGTIVGSTVLVMDKLTSLPPVAVGLVKKVAKGVIREVEKIANLPEVEKRAKLEKIRHLIKTIQPFIDEFEVAR